MIIGSSTKKNRSEEFMGNNLSWKNRRFKGTTPKGFTSKEIERWANAHIESGSVVHSDGLNCFPAVKKAGCKHIPYVTGGGA